MPFCSNCGAEVQGNFCAKCGAPVAGPAGGTATPPPSGPAPSTQLPTLSDNLAAALCYSLFFILSGVLFLVLEPYSRNRSIRFHAFQSIFVGIAAVATLIGLWIISFVLLVIPFLGVVLNMVLYTAVILGFFILWLMLMYKAYNNERWVLPVIGPLAEKQV